MQVDLSNGLYPQHCMQFSVPVFHSMDGWLGFVFHMSRLGWRWYVAGLGWDNVFVDSSWCEIAPEFMTAVERLSKRG